MTMLTILPQCTVPVAISCNTFSHQAQSFLLPGNQIVYGISRDGVRLSSIHIHKCNWISSCQLQINNNVRLCYSQVSSGEHWSLPPQIKPACEQKVCAAGRMYSSCIKKKDCLHYCSTLHHAVCASTGVSRGDANWFLLRGVSFIMHCF